LTRLRIFPEFFDFQQKLEMMPKIEKKAFREKSWSACGNLEKS